MALSRRQILCGTFALGCAQAVSSCTSAPGTGRSFIGFGDLQDDVQTGKKALPAVVESFGGEYDHPRLQRYVENVGFRLAQESEAPHLPFSFTILNSPIVNAFALPGGPVLITRGTLALCDSEAELAAVLGHEIGHVTARHTAERQGKGVLAQIGIGILAAATGSSELGQLAGMGAGLVLRSYSRSQEIEADALGARYLERTGYDIAAMASFLDSMHDNSVVTARMRGLSEDDVDHFSMMATHPRTSDRVAAAKAFVQSTSQGRVRRQEYLTQVSGMLFGDDPSQGYVRGRHFYHPGMRFTFSVPTGFSLMNSPSRVEARDAHGDAMMFDIRPTTVRSPRWHMQNEWLKGWDLGGLKEMNINGHAGAVAMAFRDFEGSYCELHVAAIRLPNGAMARIMYVIQREQIVQLADAVDAAINTFRMLTDEEVSSLRPLKLLVVEAQPGDSAHTLASGMPFGRFNEEWFRVLNGLDDGWEPAPGTPVKLAVEA